MGILSFISENIMITISLLIFVLILSSYTLGKKHLLYNFDDPRMEEHLLNKKYQLNKRKNVDLNYVNSTISKAQIIATLLSGVALFINIVFGAFFYLIAFLASTLIAIKIVGKKYENSSFK